jgi:hypothetical protein
MSTGEAISAIESPSTEIGHGPSYSRPDARTCGARVAQRPDDCDVSHSSGLLPMCSMPVELVHWPDGTLGGA